MPITSKAKWDILEYIVRQIMNNCGFKKVTSDWVYVFDKSWMQFIHWKWSAHNVDVLVEPPIQIPFIYPTRINFECKSYSQKVWLPIVRWALGLRVDINDFEVLTPTQLDARKITRRFSVSSFERNRFHYQVWLVITWDYTLDAQEFAIHHKIPLLSLRWILPVNLCRKIEELEDSENVGTIKSEVDDEIKKVVIWLTESGDMLFLKWNTLNEVNDFKEWKIKIRFDENPNEEYNTYWHLEDSEGRWLRFQLPKKVIEFWREDGYSANRAIEIKEGIFRKILLFWSRGSRYHSNFPIKILEIDPEWINTLRARD